MDALEEFREGDVVASRHARDHGISAQDASGADSGERELPVDHAADALGKIDAHVLGSGVESVFEFPLLQGRGAVHADRAPAKCRRQTVDPSEALLEVDPAPDLIQAELHSGSPHGRVSEFHRSLDLGVAQISCQAQLDFRLSAELQSSRQVAQHA